MSKATVQLSASLIIPFLLLEFVLMQGHEIIHHLTGRIVCGEWGTMTFSLFFLSEGCAETNPYAIVATAAGPLFSYGLIWAGMLLLFRSGWELIGFLTIFANLPLARFVTVATGRGDEMVIARNLAGDGTWEPVVAGAAIVLIPPIAFAWRSIRNKRKGVIIAAFLILPLLFDLVLKRVLLAPMIEAHEIFATQILGIPFFVILTDATAAFLLWLSWGRLSKTSPSVAAAHASSTSAG